MTKWVGIIGGWAQFGLTLLAQVATNQPKGWAQWLVMIASGAAAIGIHAAASTDGVK
jgi:hypothetical protein